MRPIVFVAPFPLETTMRFARALTKLHGVRVLGVCQKAPTDADARVFEDLAIVPDALSTHDVARGVEELSRKHGKIHRLLGVLEPLQVQLAEVRELLGIEGTDPGTADLFRDKARMKDALRAAGLPCARHSLLRGMRDGDRFAEEVGFPMVLKPPAGMGAKATFRVTSRDNLRAAIEGMGVTGNNPVLAEEFLRGKEFSFETITVDGEVKFTSASEYLPPCLEVLENPWIQWCCVLPRELDAPVFEQARAMGVRAVEALGLRAGFTHMEWFQRSDGTLAIGEIAQRPPGANITRMTGLAHDFDPYLAWARAVVDHRFDGPYTRQYAVGCAFLRGMGKGRVSSVEGVGQANERVRRYVVEARLPTVGAPKSDSYEGDGYAIVRARDTAVVRGALKTIVDTVRVRYAG